MYIYTTGSTDSNTLSLEAPPNTGNLPVADGDEHSEHTLRGLLGFSCLNL